MEVVGRLISLLFTLIMAGVLIMLFVANRKEVQLVLDPTSPDNPAFAVSLPFYLYMFGLLFIGALLGGFATWMSQSKWRRTARQRTQEAMRWKAEAERLTRERDANVIERKQLALAE